MNRRIPALLPAAAAFFFTFFAIGCAVSDEATEDEVMEPVPVAVVSPAGPSIDELQQELDALKTENVQMKEKLTAAEKSNRDLLSKASDLEASIAARERSAKAAASAVPVKRSFAGVTSTENIRAYKTAVDMVRKGEYRESIPRFDALLKTSVKEDYAPNCYHWMGLAYYGLQEYASALEQFTSVFDFKFSSKKDDAQLMIAQCYEKMGDPKKAKAEYDKLVKTYPASEYAPRAKKKAGQL